MNSEFMSRNQVPKKRMGCMGDYGWTRLFNCKYLMQACTDLKLRGQSCTRQEALFSNYFQSGVHAQWSTESWFPICIKTAFPQPRGEDQWNADTKLHDHLNKSLYSRLLIQDFLPVYQPWLKKAETRISAIAKPNKTCDTRSMLWRFSSLVPGHQKLCSAFESVRFAQW